MATPEKIVQGDWGRARQKLVASPLETNTQFPREANLAGSTVKTDQGAYTMQGASAGGVPIRQGVQVPPLQPRQAPTGATPENPLVVKGQTVPLPTQDARQREIDIMVKKAKDETLNDQDLRFLAERAIRQRDVPAVQPVAQPVAQPTGQPGITDIMNMTPEERLAYQQRGFQDMANQQLGSMDEFAQQQQDVYNKRIADVQAQIEAEKAKGESGNNELLKAFEAEQRAVADESKQDVTEAGAEGMDRLQRLAARRGMSRSSSTEKALVNASENTQKLVADIERQTNQSIRGYQVQLLDKLDQKIGQLEDRVYNLGEQAAEAELSTLKERQQTYAKLMASDPSNPANMLDLAQKMANQKLADSKALREEAMSVFENAIKYGFTPEALTEEQKNNIALSLGIKASELPGIIDKALTTEANKNVDVSYQVDLDGNVTAIAYNKNTGEFKTKDLGGIGEGQATRYQAVTDPITGQSRIFDPITGKFVDGGGGDGTPGYNLPTVPGQPGKVVITANTENTPAYLKENCVFFARSIVPDLPVGLITSEQKRNMINSTVPAAGSVAMMPTFGDPKIGHVAVVEQVNADGTVTIVESNVKRAADGGMAISRRTGTPAQLGIEGYWQSPKVKASNYTRPKEGEGEEINSQNVYPAETPGQLNFERVLSKGGNVDFKAGYAAYLTETGKPASNEAYQDYSNRYYAAQEQGLSQKTDTEQGAQRFTQERSLADDYNQEAKTFIGVQTAYDKVRRAARDASAAGDLSLIFGYMKMLDPSSTVREGEFANAQNAGGIETKVQAAYNNALNGQRLTEEQRADFLNQAKGLYQSEKTNIDNISNQYREIARSYGLNPDRVVFNYATGIGDTVRVQYPDGAVYEMSPEDAALAEQEGAKKI
jgi:hypothetical protein